MERNESIEPAASEIGMRNLIVASLPVREIVIGDVNSTKRLIETNRSHIRAIFWSEYGICIHSAGNENIIFAPEFHPCSSMFFVPETKRRGGGFMDPDSGARVWEGDFSPIQFSKQNLIKFLKKYADYFDDEVTTAIRSLKVTERTDSATEMISLDGSHEREVTEFQETTNLPKTFKALMPLFDGVFAELEFEACVKNGEDEYGHSRKQKVIELRCVNAREAIRGAFRDILAELPEGIPQYYGKTMLRSDRRG